MLNERRGMIHAHMVKTRDIQGIVTGQGIGIDNAIVHNHLLDDRQQGGCLHIGNGSGIDLPAPLQNAENWDFAGSSATTFAFPRRPTK